MANQRRPVDSAILAILLNPFAWSQGVTGVISGTVTSLQAPIGGATVTIVNADTGVTAWTSTTNVAGIYQAPNLPAGRYDLNVTAAGFKQEEVAGIELTVDQRAQIPVL